jgi:hypothetical protein
MLTKMELCRWYLRIITVEIIIIVTILYKEQVQQPNSDPKAGMSGKEQILSLPQACDAALDRR